MQGLCPFHSERTPSFTVFPSSRTFKCFGCGAGGDVITFVMKAENVDYREALEKLASRAGIVIPEDDRYSNNSIKRRRVLDMNREAAKFFHRELMASPEALAYLEKRRLSMSLINHFGLGFAPNSFVKLTDALRSSGYTSEEMTEGFLCGISKKTGRPYDYFRNRIMFPIIDVSGEVIAFGGRVMDDSSPKYLNSSDTPAFKKSRSLYALNFAKSACSEQLILCEGYMDVIALHGAGFTNAVATLGTAITPEHARLMKRYTQKVIISYDSDDAGQRAADRAFALLGEAGLETKILRVENAKDPDEYIKKFGKSAFEKLLSGSRSRFDFQYDSIKAKNDIKTTDGKVKAASEIGEVISRVYSNVERDIYIRRISEDLGVPYESMRADVERRMRKNAASEKKEERRQILRKTEGFADSVNPDAVRNKRAAGAEEALLGILLAYPELIKEYKNSPFFLKPDELFTSFGRRIYEAVTEENDAPFDIGVLNEKFTPDEMGRISAMIAARCELTKNDLAAAEEYAAIIRDEHSKSLGLEELIQAKRNKLKK